MKIYQKINHFPGMFYLSKKGNLCNKLMAMKKQFPREYNFFPKTWSLPTDKNKLQKEIEVIHSSLPPYI